MTDFRLAPPTPELPVPDVRAAQAYYRDTLGFEIAWYNAEGRIGAVAHGDCAIFFREAAGDISPATFWIFSAEVDASHAAFVARGADFVSPLQNTEYGLRQFTVRDPYGNRFHIFCDL